MLKHIPFYASLMGKTLTYDHGGTVKKQANAGHVLVYGAIEAHSMGDQGCIASNKTIAAETGLSTGRVANLISELNRYGWVEVHMDYQNNQRKGINPLLTLHAGVNPPSRWREPPLHAGVNIEDSKEDSKKTSSNENVELFNQMAETLGFNVKRVQFTVGRQNKMKNRLKRATPDQLREAAMRLSKSAWHMGDNPNGVKYASMDFLLRSDEMIEKWANYESFKKKQGGGVVKI